ncbi:MAG: hypothetical protein GYA47_02565 [Desulfovibrio sp.]|nr:hypothetical protein [Desulfovibrio sp.]
MAFHGASARRNPNEDTMPTPKTPPTMRKNWKYRLAVSGMETTLWFTLESNACQKNSRPHSKPRRKRKRRATCDLPLAPDIDNPRQPGDSFGSNRNPRRL